MAIAIAIAVSVSVDFPVAREAAIDPADCFDSINKHKLLASI